MSGRQRMNSKLDRKKPGIKTDSKTLIVFSAVIMGLLILIVSRFNIPNPNMILITAMILFTGIGGVIPGAVSAVMMLIYSMYFFSTDHSMFQYTEVNTQKMLVIVFGVVINFIIVSLLKKNQEEDHQKLLNLNKDLMQTNAYLSEKAKAAERISELTESVTSLLTNMPAMTFSKDIKTGKYLACNQSFADYACKDTPNQVIGLTDAEIFDAETAAHFVEDDKKALEMDEPYIFLEDVADAMGRPRHFQTTKQKFTDTTGRLCMLGMSVDVSELVKMKDESRRVREAYKEMQTENLTYSHIAGALMADYTNLYYVDLVTEKFTEYLPDPVHGELTVLRQDDDFFLKVEQDARKLIYEKDLDSFLKVFNKDSVLKSLDDAGLFTHSYRLLIDGVPNYVNMKAIPMHEDREHIVIGVRNVDRQTKVREAEERVKAERITYSRMNALTGDFIAVYVVDPQSGKYIEYSGTDAYDNLGINKEGDDFFEQSRINAFSSIYSDDLDKFFAIFTKNNILKAIKDDGVFTIDYRLVLEGKPVFVMLRAAMVEEEGGPQLIVGVNNIDAQVKRQEEFDQKLAVMQKQATRDELTGVKNKHAYAELEKELNHQIQNNENVAFAVSVFDVNELKTINDTKGHQAGDALLKNACGIICRIFAHSPVFRVGGDEFAVVSRGYDYDHIEELLLQIEQTNKENAAEGGIVIAGGMAKYAGEDKVSDVFEKADALMYSNKRSLKGF